MNRASVRVDAEFGRPVHRYSDVGVDLNAGGGILDLGLILDQVSRTSQTHADPHTPCAVLFLAPAHACRLLIGTCNPMLCPIHASRPMGGCCGWLLWVVAMGGC